VESELEKDVMIVVKVLFNYSKGFLCRSFSA